MAEKEERILIKKQINYHPPYGGWRRDGKEIVLTRQEAIERIAKAFSPWDFFPHEIEEGKGWKDLNEWQKGKYLAQARKALNALLGE